MSDNPIADKLRPVVYVIYCVTGECLDRSERTVRAFLDEGAAKAFVECANAWLAEHGLHVDACSAHYEAQSIVDELGAPSWDPSMRVDYTGAEYSFGTIPLGGAS